MSGWSRPVLAVRFLVVAAGALALVVARGDGASAAPVLAGAVGLALAAVRPGGAGPAVVLVGAALGWALDSGTGQAPAAGTVLLAAALAVHHQAAALAAALPVTARVDRAVLVRAARHGALVLALSAVVAVLALAVARPGGSVPLELLGLAAAVVAVAVPVLLTRVAGDTR